MSFQRDTVNQINRLDRQLDALSDVEIDVQRGITSLFLQLPGLIGYWPMSAFDLSSGDAIDQSGTGKTLTYNGDPFYNNSGIIPLIDLDGTGDELTRTDEADLDILGTETHVASTKRGLTCLGWYQFDTTGSTERLNAKWGNSGQFSWRLRKDTDETISMAISTDGSAATTVSSSNTVATTGWFFCVGRFRASTSLDVFVNGTQTENTTSIPASIFNSTAALALGGGAAGQRLNGRMSNVALCAAAITVASLNSIFQLTKNAYGVD